MSDEGWVHPDLEELSSLLNQFSSPLDECRCCVGQHAESVAVLVQVFLELDPVLDKLTAVVFAPTVEDFVLNLLLLGTQALILVHF